MKTFMTLFVGAAWAAGVCVGATVTLPIAEVKDVADFQEKRFPAKVLPLQRVDVTPEVSGDIVEVCFTDGALVKANDVLYKILPVKYVSALKNAEAKVAECKAKKAYADAAYERHAKLIATKAVSQDAVDNAKSDQSTAAAALAAAEAELAVADYNLKRCQIRTPIDGRTGTTRLTRGNPASPATPLVTVVQIQPIRVRFSLSNADFLTMFGGRGKTLEEKGEVSVTLANGSAYPEKGMIDHTENVTDEATDTVRVYASFPNADYILKPYSAVGVTLRNKDGVKKRAVPPTAVMQDAEGAYVWVVVPNQDRGVQADGKVTKRRITRGRLADDMLLVESGLAAGERVIADGTHKVMEGDYVTEAK